jgi:hypothetical protein
MPLAVKDVIFRLGDRHEMAAGASKAVPVVHTLEKLRATLV